MQQLKYSVATRLQLSCQTTLFNSCIHSLKVVKELKYNVAAMLYLSCFTTLLIVVQQLKYNVATTLLLSYRATPTQMQLYFPLGQKKTVTPGF